MSGEDKAPAESVLLQVVVNVRVPLQDDPPIHDAAKAVQEAERLVDLSPLLQQRERFGADYAEFGDCIVGALVDFGEDPEYERSTYVPLESAAYLSTRAYKGIEALIGSPSAPVEALLMIAEGKDLGLSTLAARTIAKRPDATVENVCTALSVLLEADPDEALDFLEQNRQILRRLPATLFSGVFSGNMAAQSKMRAWGLLSDTAVPNAAEAAPDAPAVKAGQRAGRGRRRG
jgi:hypothetical protein